MDDLDQWVKVQVNKTKANIEKDFDIKCEKYFTEWIKKKNMNRQELVKIVEIEKGDRIPMWTDVALRSIFDMGFVKNIVDHRMTHGVWFHRKNAWSKNEIKLFMIDLNYSNEDRDFVLKKLDDSLLS